MFVFILIISKIVLLPIITLPEFLQAAILQSHDCTKSMRICAKECNSGKTNKHYLTFGHNLLKVVNVLHVFMAFLMHISVQNNKHLILNSYKE